MGAEPLPVNPEEDRAMVQPSWRSTLEVVAYEGGDRSLAESIGEVLAEVDRLEAENKQLLTFKGLPSQGAIYLHALKTIDRLQRAIRFSFCLNPDTSDGTELIGREMLPMPDDIRQTIIGECEAAEATPE